MFLSKHAVCESKSKFIKQQNVSGLLNSLGIKTTLSIILLVAHVLFQRSQQANTRYKMNEKVNKILLEIYKCMPEIPLRQPEFP